MGRIRILTFRGGYKFPRLLRDRANYTILNQENSGFRGREDDVIINWGKITTPAWAPIVPRDHWLNHPENVGYASNKQTAFMLFNNRNVPIPQFTTDIRQAEEMIRNGSPVYCRTVLNGQGGAGIHIARTVEDLVPAPLYTRGIGRCREYRIHVFLGEVIHIAQKRRRRGLEDDVNTEIKNYHNGWIYATHDITQPSQEAREEALRAVGVLGLDFGAVDVAERQGTPYVLEVNTAPGVEGVTVDVYVNAIQRWVGERIRR